MKRITIACDMLERYIGEEVKTDRAVADAVIAILKDTEFDEMLESERKTIDKPGGVKQEQGKAEEKPAAEKTQTKKKSFDTGKMIALLRAGWNVPKVADEMGVSEATIYNHMKKEGIKLK